MVSRDRAFRGAYVSLALAFVALAVVFSSIAKPASGAVNAVSIEGETMSLPSGSGQAYDDGTASGSRALLVWSNATASKTFDTAGPSDSVKVRVKADQCDGSPQMTVRVDGRQVIQDWVWQTGYAEYAAPVSLAEGGHKVEVSMGHDRSTYSCDRNLRVDRVAFASAAAPTPAPSPTPTSSPTPGFDVFEGATLYLDPDSNAKRQADLWRSTRPEDARQMDKIASGADADWIGEWSGEVRAAVDARVTEITDAGALPVLVAYNIPNRDCGGYAAGGASSPEAYKTWMRAFANGLEGRKAAVIIEPDALAAADCLSETDRATRFALLKDAVNVLEAQGQTATYIDAGHSAWIPAAEMSTRLTEAGVAGGDGFSLNVSNFRTTPENTGYGRDVSSRVGGKHFVIDTSRNGLGPTADSQWCNPPGRALGEKPSAVTTDPLVDAYLWIKTPGESDGSCAGGPPTGQWWPEYALGLAQRAAY